MSKLHVAIDFSIYFDFSIFVQFNEVLEFGWQEVNQGTRNIVQKSVSMISQYFFEKKEKTETRNTLK